MVGISFWVFIFIFISSRNVLERMVCMSVIISFMLIGLAAKDCLRHESSNCLVRICPCFDDNSIRCAYS